jgi:hypothetical protein
MRQLDLKQLAAQVWVEHGIRVDPDDPIMAVVTLNRLVLEHTANEIVEEVRLATREFEQAAESVQLRAGALVAQRVRNCVAVLRQDIVNDIANASTRARKSIRDVGRADESPSVQRWVAIGLLSGAVLLGCGVLLRAMLR